MQHKTAASTFRIGGMLNSPQQNSRRTNLEFPAFEPATQMLTLTFRLSPKTLRTFTSSGASASIMEADDSVRQILSTPDAIFVGPVYPSNYQSYLTEPIHDKSDWRCYVGKPKFAYDASPKRPWPKQYVLMVLVDGEGEIKDWRTVVADRADNAMPSDYQCRFEQTSWRRAPA